LLGSPRRIATLSFGGIAVLLAFRVANHRSIHEEQQLLLTPVYDGDRLPSTEWEAMPVAAIFGANAAGKSNIVGALTFMSRMVDSSWREAIPDGGVRRAPFRLDPDAARESSWYAVDLLLDGVRHTYGFSVDDERVLDEWLHSYPKGQRRVVFERFGDEVSFGETSHQRELGLVRTITEPNVLLLSVAARSRQEEVRPVFDWFTRGVRFLGASGSTRHRPHVPHCHAFAGLFEDPSRAANVIELLRAADLGIVNAGVERAETHNGEGESRPVPRVWIEHRGRTGATRMPLADESQGTQALFSYAAPVLETLRTGGLLVVDEIDASLHPGLTARLIGLFQRAESNPLGAQLLLTTHDASLLGRSGGEDILKRDQVWFVEKNEHGETRLFPLSEFKPRQDENRERRYLGGSYGAVPFLSDERFVAAVAAREGAGSGEDTQAERA
jgi:hypothetical protein